MDACRIGVAGGFDGVTFDDRGRPWLGGREGDGLVTRAGDAWYNVMHRATADNDSSGLFDFTMSV